MEKSFYTEHLKACSQSVRNVWRERGGQESVEGQGPHFADPAGAPGSGSWDWASSGCQGAHESR